MRSHIYIAPYIEKVLYDDFLTVICQCKFYKPFEATKYLRKSIQLPILGLVDGTKKKILKDLSQYYI